MTVFMGENFLLHSDTARELYYGYAHEMAWVGEMVENISFNNARRYFAKG